MKQVFRRTLLPALLIALALNAQAETVYFSAKGKNYHKSQTCIALNRAAKKFHAERSEAEKHGLVPCAICYRPPAKKATPSNDWAKEGK